MATLKEILHILADGISLAGPVREQLHADIDAHDQAPEASADPGDVSRETDPVVTPVARPVTPGTGA